MSWQYGIRDWFGLGYVDTLPPKVFEFVHIERQVISAVKRTLPLLTTTMTTSTIRGKLMVHECSVRQGHREEGTLRKQKGEMEFGV